jgi:predicted 2-oxoglutarate/Fe(II)-dependent dioxygenase YbiX
LVALSLNLNTVAYAGGTLELREVESKKSVQLPNITFGDAILFRVADYLEHRVTPVEGAEPKTAFAGWFRTTPDYCAWRAKKAAISFAERRTR